MIDERAPLAMVKTPLRNRRKKALTLRIEPWGEEYTVAPGATVQILARGPAGDELDIRWGDDRVTVYGWPGSIVSVLRKGKDVSDASDARAARERTTAPFLPEGMRMSEWMAAMSEMAAA
jgi:hypothetical protein